MNIREEIAFLFVHLIVVQHLLTSTEKKMCVCVFCVYSIIDFIFEANTKRGLWDKMTKKVILIGLQSLSQH